MDLRPRITCGPGLRNYMKFSQIGRVALASISSAAVCLGLTACTTAHTVAFLYATASNKGTPGFVNGFKVDSDSGAVTPLPGTPFAAGLNPIALVPSPNESNLYVVNHDDNTVTEYTITPTGPLTASHSYPVVGSVPTSLAIDPSGKYLIVAATYQPGYSATKPGPGALTIFPINSDGTLGTPVANGGANFVPTGCNPVGVNITAVHNFVYVVDQNFATPSAACTPTSSTPATSPIAPLPLVIAFSLNTSNGALTSIPGSPNTNLGLPAGALAGVQPSGIASEPMGRYVYVSDQASNQLIGYVVQADGSLIPMVNGPFSTGLFPVGVAIDPRGKYLFVPNYNGPSISSYALNLGTGTPSAVASAAQAAVPAGPTCVAIEPALGQYLFSSNFLDGSITGETLDTHTGALAPVQNTPFNVSGQPTCVATVGSGAHAVQTIQP